MKNTIFYCLLLFTIVLLSNPCQAQQKTDSFPTLTEKDFPDSEADRFTRLTNLDYERVAKQLGIEIATIKAVSDIEAGKTHQGFADKGMPLVNFSTALFRQGLSKAGIKASQYTKSHSTAFSSLNRSKYGSYGKAQYARLSCAMEINEKIAIESAYWGMFQIGGFNWQRCGVSSAHEFAQLMSESEAMQLELFARFIENCGMVKYLKNKNWTAFAKAYNGPNALRKGYHKRMAAAYAKYKK